MSVIRAFIAIDLAPDIRRKLDQVSFGLKQLMTEGLVRWVSADNIHLTLKFLGDVSVANLETLKEILRQEASACAPFDIRVEELGAFPTLHRPRVIWVNVHGPQELVALQQSIDEETARLGYAREERAFSPHLTLGRVSRRASPGEVRRLGEILASAHPEHPGAMRVDAVHLFRSDLRPSGAVYTCLDTAPLSK